MPLKLTQMLSDLERMRNELCPNAASGAQGAASAAELKDMDEFARKQLALSTKLRDVRTDVMKLQELRRAVPGGRDVNTIRLNNQNSNNLKEAAELWKAAKAQLLRDEKKKKLDVKSVDERRQALAVMAKDMQELSNLNAHVHESKEVDKVEQAIAQHQEDKRRRQRERARLKKEEAGGAVKKPLKKGDLDWDTADERDAAQSADPAQQEFMQEFMTAKAVEDEMLDELGKGMVELKEMSNTMKGNINEQAVIQDEIERNINRLKEKFTASNSKLKEMLEESGGATRWCPTLICLVLLVALVSYMFKLVSRDALASS